MWAHGTRATLIVAAVLAGGLLAAGTELLGAAGWLRRGPVAGLWLAAVAAAAWKLRLRVAVPRVGVVDGVLLAVIAAALGVTAYLVAVCPPNNWDVILYHLPRQVQWAQQGSVAHFPTQDYRLTVNPPLAEFAGLHLLLLTGTDRLYGLVSWAACGLTLVAVSLLARDLGAGRTGQLLAAAFAATVPVGVHEAANGKNDWLVSLWLVSAAWLTLRTATAERIRVRDAALVGLAFGLLVLTKGTGGVFAVPVAVFGTIVVIARRPAGWWAWLLVPLVAAGVNAGHWHRNLSAYGSVSGQTFGLANEAASPGVLVSNLARNVGMHLATPRERWNRRVERAVAELHAVIGRPLDDPAATWYGCRFRVEYGPQKEDFATAPVHAVLLVLCLASGLRKRAGGVSPGGDGRGCETMDRSPVGSPVEACSTGPLTQAARLATARPVGPAWAVYLAAAGGLVVFAAAFKWQPWHPRLHLPLFVLAAPAFGVAFARPKVCWLAPLAVGGMVWAAVPAAVRSEARPLVGPTRVGKQDAATARFLGDAAVLAHARAAVERVRALDAAVVDLINQAPSPWEYPLTVLLRDAATPPHVGYFYPVAGSPDGPPADAVIDVSGLRPPGLIRHPRTRRFYQIASTHGPFAVYRPARPGDEFDGHRLAPSGVWEPVPGQPNWPPPTADHAVARFGVGAEPPAVAER